MNGPIENRREALEDLARRLGIEAAGLKAGESDSGINGSGQIAAALLEKISQDDLDRWFGAFGQELRLTFKCREDESVTWSATQADHAAASLRKFLEDCRQYTDPSITLDLDIGKPDPRGFVPGLTADGSVQAVLFFYGDRLEELLSRIDERSFETDFLKVTDRNAADRRLLILVADTPGLLAGPYLAILGNDHHDATAATLGPAPSFEKTQAARDLTREVSNRENAPRVLTPDFFELTRKEKLDGCQQALARLQNRLVASSLANRTFRDETQAGGLISVFVGERVVEVPLKGTAQSTGPEPFRLYRWVHEDAKVARTRLEIVRRVTASHLPPKSPTNFDQFVAQSEQILADSVVQLNVLIDGNIIDSFERQEKLEGIVQTYVQDVGGRIAALGKEVIDNTYKTVGLLAGVAIAYLLKPDAGVLLLVIAILLYEAYVAFVRYFYIKSLKEDFRTERRSFEERWQSMQQLLKFIDPGVTTRLASKVKEKNDKFDCRYDSVNRLYNLLFAVGLLVLLAALAVHGYGRPDTVRARVLTKQMDVFRELGYQDLRADLPDQPRPEPLAVGRGKMTPGLTARRNDAARPLVIVEYVPCSRLRDHQQLERLKALKTAADSQQAELQLLTEEKCSQAGQERAGEWLDAEGLGGLQVWAR